MRKQWLLGVVLLTAGCQPVSNENENLSNSQVNRKARSMPAPFEDTIEISENSVETTPPSEPRLQESEPS